MLYTIMKSIKNFFPTSKCVDGEFIIEGGTISLPFISEGQYFLIEGSVMNDGVYCYPVDSLSDEAFNGFVTLLNPPKDFLDLVSEIESYVKTNAPSAYTSESFGGYSYSKSSNSGGGLADWSSAFRERLNVWRRV